MIATPIGNLGDITYRAVETLKSLDLLLCEDTRVTRRLLDHYGITVTTESYREQVHFQKITRVAGLLREGKTIGIVSDAGTPGISDPGFRLVRDILQQAPDTKIVPMPGPSAVAAAVSVSGLPSDSFVFMGFPPHKKGRAAFFRETLGQDRTTVLYESTHRIAKALNEITALDPVRPLAVCRELTKMFETIYRGTAAEIMKQLDETSSKGEFVIVIGPSK
ncbi:16S rRNA (cytidine(1402)-2'-O)-methyltransferase [Candidatus Uhrbacteria bacterium RIFCSPHIGHO2_02_FULL_60_10]|uniref:Ribosomal RNA small subunit methyltransferase I n=1 Tax=Candidatus Uhrbacteria bacterium RIFCSPHIGHO2_02_FULL_60_10 TaxID=1802392 RepID=A0A1F7U6E0_9BACT|nr:MAG: 16S rRNA (cytidine(1402)-2'-O)-methyltransferase [Candidatus Uhrbacteria bacterium RIFCSPHIGHO2_02_FULL_60_10]